MDNQPQFYCWACRRTRKGEGVERYNGLVGGLFCPDHDAGEVKAALAAKPVTILVMGHHLVFHAWHGTWMMQRGTE